MAMSQVAPLRPSMLTAEQRAAMREFADAITPLMKMANNPFEQAEFAIGPATRATVRFSGPVSPAEIDRLCSHLTLMREVATGGKFLDAESAKAMVREMLEDHLARQAR